MNKLISKNHWLGVAEALALGATIGGSVAAEVLSQSALLSAPLSITLCLSLLNRRRLHKAMQQYTAQELEQLRQDFYQLDQLVLATLKTNRQAALLTGLPETIADRPVITVESVNVSSNTPLEPNTLTDLTDLEALSLEKLSALERPEEPPLADVANFEVDCNSSSTLPIEPLPTEHQNSPDPVEPVPQVQVSARVQPPEFTEQLRADVTQLQVTIDQFTSQVLPNVKALQAQLGHVSAQLQQLLEEQGQQLLAQTIATFEADISQISPVDEDDPTVSNHATLDSIESGNEPTPIDRNALQGYEGQELLTNEVASWIPGDDFPTEEFEDLVEAIVQLEQPEARHIALN